jgi:hypothetical protein
LSRTGDETDAEDIFEAVAVPRMKIVVDYDKGQAVESHVCDA